MTEETGRGAGGVGTAAPTAPGGAAGHGWGGADAGGPGGGGGRGDDGGAGSASGWGSGWTGGRGPRPDGPRLVRSRRHKVIGGVCGGLGRYFDLDPVIFRVCLGVLSVIGGVGLIAYGVAWLLLPFDDYSENEGRRMLSGRVDGPGLTALLLVVVGFGLLLASLPGRSQSFSMLLLVGLIGVGFWSRHQRGLDGSGADTAPDPATAQAVASAPPEVQAPPVPATASWWREGAAPQDGYLWGPSGATPPRSAPAVDLSKDGAGGTGGPYAAPPTWRDEAQPPAGRRGFWLGGPVLLAALAAATAVGALSWDQPLGTALVYAGSAALTVFGLGMGIGAFWGRIGTGTILAAVATAALVVAASVLPASMTTHWTAERWTPASVAEVEPRYETGSGRATLDLSQVGLSDGERLATTMTVGGGQLRVYVPRDVTVEVTADIWLGGYTFGDREDSERGPNGRVQGGGFRADWSGTYGPPPGTDPTGVVELRLSVGLGHIEIERMAGIETDPHPADAERTTEDEPVEAAAPVREQSAAAPAATEVETR
ncbi:PspC domain-containing protein [Streptomyces bohaiensis]|uniref:PspC domain-containing protein n=1 Tax=Streptomyces bohaiensis TaxID=1431344 RepID=UPI003B804C90